MAILLVHPFQISNIFDNMGQSQSFPTEKDLDIYDGDTKQVSPIERNSVKQDAALLHSDVQKTKDPPWNFSTTDFGTGTIKEAQDDDTGILYSSNNNVSLDTDTINDDLPNQNYEEQLCAGETLDDARPAKNNEQVTDTVDRDGAELECNHDDIKSQEYNNISNPVTNGSSKAPMDWSEKKRQFSMMKQYGDSFSSDVSSDSRHSVSSYLNARVYDAEEILARLGFGGDMSVGIPARFLAKNSLVSSNMYIESASVTTSCDDDVFVSGVTSTLTSIESSWSDSSFGKLPSRFTSSLGRSSLSSLSEPEDNDTNAVIPSIVEPETDVSNDGFDLMRHLRLNRFHNDKGFLEPVTEELEVSSVCSGSARTKVSAQQDSFESIGNISVATKIFVPKVESEEKKEEQVTVLTPVLKEILHIKETENSKDEKYDLSPETCQTLSQTNVKDIPSHVQRLSLNVPNKNSGNSECREGERPNVSNTMMSDLTKENSQSDFHIDASEQNNLEPKPISPLSLRPYLSLKLPQDSFELEEIATSEENLDKIIEHVPRKFKRRENLRRDNSDDSSGFGDDAIDVISKKSISKNTPTMKENVSKEGDIASSLDELNKMHLDVPRQMSTPIDSATARRSSFAKRQSWSTTKQRRVLFEDEALQKCQSLDDLQSKRKLFEFKSRSLDRSLPESSYSPQNMQSNDNSRHTSFQSHSLDIPSRCSSRLSLESDQDMQLSSSRELKVNNIPLFQSEGLSDTCENQSQNSRKHKVVCKSHSVDIPWDRNLSNSSPGISLQEGNVPRKVNFKRRSLDLSLPTSNENNISGVSVSLGHVKSDKRSTMELQSQAIELPHRQKTSENKAIINIKEFMSNLWSLRSKFKKSSITSKPESLPISSCEMLEHVPFERNGDNLEHVTEDPSLDTSQLARLDKTTPSITVGLFQHESTLDELTAFKEDLQKYSSCFVAMGAISTSQDSYYTRKLQARFAWDILFIHRLRSYIKEELDEIQSNLEHRTTLPLGVHSQMVALLRLQSGLREYLLSLANTAAKCSSLKAQPVKTTAVQSLNIDPLALTQIENKIRSSVVQEVKSTFELQLGELRQEMKAKDSLIEELLKRIPKTEAPL